MTIFDAAGKELPVTAITATAVTTGGGPTPVTMTLLEPWYAVGHRRTVAGVPIAVTVTGTAPGGAPISFALSITPDR